MVCYNACSSMGRITQEGYWMNLDELWDASANNSSWVEILAKAILLDKVFIEDGQIKVKAFTEND